jgi:hypothetical protein
MAEATGKTRLVYLDNLRLLMIVFTVTLHLAMAYGGLGDWYYKEQGQLEGLQLVIFNFIQLFTQSFFIGIMFIITGYFAPASYDKKGFYKFVRNRLYRLGIPALAYMLIIYPFIIIVLLQVETFSISTYIKYITSLQFIEYSGPQWFTVALLVFSIAYAAVRHVGQLLPGGQARQNSVGAAGCGSPENSVGAESTGSFPSIPSILAFILVMSACTFFIRVYYPMGKRFLGVPLCFFPQYALLFFVGIKCRRGKWLDSLDYAKGKPWLILGLALGLAFWVGILVATDATGGDFINLLGGRNWYSAAYVLWESFVSIFMSIGMFALFKEKCNNQNKLFKAMSGAAFSVFVIHPPIIVALTLLVKPVNASLIAKFLMLAPVNILACFVLAYFTIGKIPILRKLLA